jgi:hypothetical protein
MYGMRRIQRVRQLQNPGALAAAFGGHPQEPRESPGHQQGAQENSRREKRYRFGHEHVGKQSVMGSRKLFFIRGCGEVRPEQIVPAASGK